jgi:hypothetical protein
MGERWLPATTRRIKYTDNFYLKTGTEAGWIGLAAFITCISGCGWPQPVDMVATPITRQWAWPFWPDWLRAAHNAVENVFEVP